MASGPSISQTIYALSTAPGRAGIAVIRVSGSEARRVFDAVVRPQKGPIRPRTAMRANFVRPSDGVPIDDGLLLWFPGPQTFTGEDLVELHTHGGRAVVAGVLEALGQLPGFRTAEPGEFTRRAFESGKLDLTEAEGLADLIDAETETQRSLALSHMGGVLRRAADKWRLEIIGAQALAEAAIDFSDEGDVSRDAWQQAQVLVDRLAEDIGRHIDDAHRGEIMRDGFRVAVVGRPNAGKSSLINALAGREVVIVSEEAGTTRDVVELHLNLGGVRVILADTAGLRVAEGKVELEGIRRGMAWARGAHLLIWLRDATDAAADKFPESIPNNDVPRLVVWNKIDMLSGRTITDLGEGRMISAVRGDGIDELVEDIRAHARARTDGGEHALISQHRHRQALVQSRYELRAFLNSSINHPEIGAEHLRSAAVAMGKLTGRIDVEEILGAIFGRFCIGK